MKVTFPEDLKDQDEMRRIGQRLRTLRLKRKWSSYTFGKKVGLSHTAVLKIEMGDVNIQLARLRQLARALGTTAEALMARDPEQLTLEGLRAEVVNKIAEQYSHKLFA